MRLTELKVRTILQQVSNEQAAAAFEDGYNALVLLNNFKDLLVDEKDYKGEAGGGFEWLQVEEAEVVSNDLNFEGLKFFNRGKCSYTDAIQRRAASSVHYLQLLKERVDEVSEVFIPMDNETIEMLRELCLTTLGELAYFLYFQFQLEDTLTDLSEGNDPRVNVALAQFVDESGNDLEQVVTFVSEIMTEHRPTFTIFEEFPDLEDPFFEIVGPYVKDFERIIDFVTAEVVRDVIKNAGDVEEIVRDLESSIKETEVE